jgi:hypothetical protein
MELKRILPICARCKSIRNDKEYWQSLECYMKHHLDLDFSHSICPKCARELYPEYLKKQGRPVAGKLIKIIRAQPQLRPFDWRKMGLPAS